MTYIRPALKGYPIREKKIKGHIYLYQRIEAYRDKETGQVHVTDRYLGAKKVSRPKPMLDQLSAATQRTIMTAWRQGEAMSHICAYLKNHAGIETTPNTIYKWFREKGITRGARPQTAKRATTMEQRLEQRRLQKKREIEIKARQAQRRAQMRKEIEGR